MFLPCKCIYGVFRARPKSSGDRGSRPTKDLTLLFPPTDRTAPRCSRRARSARRWPSGWGRRGTSSTTPTSRRTSSRLWPRRAGILPHPSEKAHSLSSLSDRASHAALPCIVFIQPVYYIMCEYMYIFTPYTATLLLFCAGGCVHLSSHTFPQSSARSTARWQECRRDTRRPSISPPLAWGGVSSTPPPRTPLNFENWHKCRRGGGCPPPFLSAQTWSSIVHHQPGTSRVAGTRGNMRLDDRPALAVRSLFGLFRYQSPIRSSLE